MSIKHGLVAVALTPEDGVKEGQCAVTPDGTVWQYRTGFWRRYPWWQRSEAEEIIAICADPDDWHLDFKWTRKQIEESVGALIYIRLPNDPPALPADTTAAKTTNGYQGEVDPAVVPVGLDERKDA